jgi:hypothetical protein
MPQNTCRYRSNEQVTKKTLIEASPYRARVSRAVGAHDNDIRAMLAYAGKDFLLSSAFRNDRFYVQVVLIFRTDHCGQPQGRLIFVAVAGIRNM